MIRKSISIKKDLFNAGLLFIFIVLAVLALDLIVDAWIACSQGACSSGQEYIAVMSIVVIAAIVLGVVFNVVRYSEIGEEK